MVVVKFPNSGRQVVCLCLAYLALQTQVVSSAETETPVPQAKAGKTVALFDGKSIEGWRIIDTFDFTDHGKVDVKDGVITLGAGEPATGISWKGKVPRSNYELNLQAKRLDGGDFFCGLTFPVKKEHCTLILGGWGGQVVGLSNIDGFSAIENETTQVIEFEKGRWYDIRLLVLDDSISVFVDKKKIINTRTGDRKFSIWWEQEPVTPLGIVTWNTTGAIRGLKMERVDSENKSK